jgi:response regulator RpfG family c-di-GMP phosphodiesterase
MNKAKVLLVDDVATNIEVLANALKQDYNILVATNGHKALELAEEQMPDLILLDIMMPQMNGYDVCRKLKENDVTHQIPVIFVSAMTDTEDEELGFLVGAVDYIHKPFKISLVRARVKTHILLKQQADLLRAVAQMNSFGFDQAESLVAEINQTLERL